LRYENIKITTQEDLVVAEALMGERRQEQEVVGGHKKAPTSGASL
jgi:hypothetical protein